MKKLTFVLVLAFAAAAFGADNKSVSPAELAARRARAREMFIAATGGQVIKPGTQQGEVVYVNCQSRIPRPWIEESVVYFAKETKFKITLRDGGSFDLRNPKVEGNATLFVIDDAALPAILVAPENRWAFVNVAPVAKEQRPAFFEARMKKELSRGFAYLCGAANSQYPRALTRGIVDHADLDKNPDLRLPIDLFQRFRTYMETLGVKPATIMPYRVACQEGWAPSPTNDVQKAIWNEVHEIPAKPLKIQFDAKTDGK